MKLVGTAAIAATAIVLASISVAMAGVVVKEQEVVNRGNGPETHTRTIMIEGNKQKIISERDVMVTDLDKGMMILMNPASKTYTEMPFPPKAERVRRAMAQAENVKFKKTGATRTIDGYHCEDYRGVSRMMGTESKITQCFSSTAPGAAEFAAFQKAMLKRLKHNSEREMLADMPSGVPLLSESTTNMTGLKIPGMPPEQAKKFAQMMAHRPPIVSKTKVTKITIKHLSADVFAAPAGYTQKEFQSGPPAGAGQPRAHSLPE